MNRDERLAAYDEGRELTEYLLFSFSHLLSAIELRVEKTLQVEWKADAMDATNPRMAGIIRQRWSKASDPEVIEALRDGIVAFRARTRARILAVAPAELVINRCPACDRIVATPRARQCLWCGADWH